MAMLTVRNLDEALKIQLRISAAKHGRSMEEEVRRILRQSLLPETEQKGLGSRLHKRVMDLTGGVELELPSRSPPSPAPDFSGKAE